MHNNLLKDKKGIIFGVLDNNSIATYIAKQCIKEGASIILTNSAQAVRNGYLKDISKELGMPIIIADISNIDDIKKLIDKSIHIFNGKIDFILHSVGMSYNIRRKVNYVNADIKYFNKTLHISAISLHSLLKICFQKDAINEWGSIITLTHLASNKFFDGYNDMSDAKALLESIVRNFGYYYSKYKKVRINSISQSPIITRSSVNIPNFKYILEQSCKKSPLGNASAEMCANYCITLFSDYTRMVTMQTLFHDGGYSIIGY